MVIEFRAAVDEEKTFVYYIRDGTITARYETTDALATINGLMQRVHADPHMVFDIQVRITGSDISFSPN
jgi:hypothetical protein